MTHNTAIDESSIRSSKVTSRGLSGLRTGLMIGGAVALALMGAGAVAGLAGAKTFMGASFATASFATTMTGAAKAALMIPYIGPFLGLITGIGAVGGWLATGGIVAAGATAVSMLPALSTVLMGGAALAGIGGLIGGVVGAVKGYNEAGEAVAQAHEEAEARVHREAKTNAQFQAMEHKIALQKAQLANEKARIEALVNSNQMNNQGNIAQSPPLPMMQKPAQPGRGPGNG